VVDISVLGYALDSLIFVFFRLLSAGVVTVAAGYILYHQLFTKRLAPPFVWSYVGICLTIVAAFRWFVVFITIPELADFYKVVEPWLQPMTQAGYVLLGMSIVVLTFTHIKARERHYSQHHGWEPDG
jgi:hypothetical protein